jgi:hypothetical protein
LQNPGFNGSASSWTLQSGITYQANVDVNNCSGSGSVNISALAAFTTCVDAQKGTRYYFGFRFKGQGGYCYMNFLNSDSCSVSATTSGLTLDLSDPDSSWQDASGTAVSENDTRKIFIGCSGAIGSGNYDQFYLSTTNPDEVSGHRF